MFDKINEDMGINLSASNSETFRALHRKLERDYRPFLQGILKKYPGPSNIHTQAKAAVLDVDATIDLFSNALRENIISATVAEELGTALRTSLSTIAELFQANMVNEEFTAAFLANLEKIKKETGIGTEALTVSEKAIAQGEREARAASSKALEMLKPLAPLGNKMKGVGTGAMTALAGPFAPILEAGAGVLGNVGKKMFARAISRKKDSGTKDVLNQLNVRSGEVRSASQFKASHGGGTMPGGTMGQVLGGVRQAGALKPMSGRGSNLASMVLFYNKHAYTSKWTKELLETTKKIQKRQSGEGSGGSFLGGIGSMLGLGAASKAFGKLGTTLGALTGKAGALGVFALKLGAVGVVLAEVGLIGKSMFDWWNQRDKTRKAQESARATAVENSKQMRAMGIKSVVAGTGKSESQLVDQKAQRRQSDYNTVYDDLTSTWLGRRVAKFKGIERKAKISADDQRKGAGEIGALTRRQHKLLVDRSNTEEANGTSSEELAEILAELRDGFKQYNETLLKSTDTRFRDSQLPNPGSRPRIDTRDSYDYEAGDGGI